MVEPKLTPRMVVIFHGEGLSKIEGRYIPFIIESLEARCSATRMMFE
jgi:hypothetical protein